MLQKKSAVLQAAIAASLIGGALACAPALAQTAFGSSTTIVFPVVASTATFTTTVTLYNPNGSDVTVGLDYFDARDSDPQKSPLVAGQKPCNDVVVPANGSVAFTLASQCTLGDGPHFGPLVASDNAGVSQIFGYSRTENNASAGFSIEGFPSEDLTTDTTNVVGLRGSTIVAPPPSHQTNCFVTAQADAITYDMKFFDGATGAQIGSTVSGALNAFEQIRYLDVFSSTVASAPAATDFSNVRAEFTRTSDDGQMVAFCSVQDNATFGADFRIAKALTPPPPPPPPPPVGTLVLAGTWSGSIPSIVRPLPPLPPLPLAFIGSTMQVTLAAPNGLSAYGGGWFSKKSSGPGSLSLGVCYQDISGPGPVTLLGSANTVSVNGTLSYKSAAGSTGSVPAGSYAVGLCGQNIGTNDINKNAHTSGFVFIGS
jgi:hypothetical protein